MSRRSKKKTMQTNHPPSPAKDVRLPEDAQADGGLSGGGWDRGALWVAGAVLAARVTYALLTQYLLDDALITARYGRNLLEGGGLAFNAGDPSYGFTSPLWVLFSSLGTLLQVPPHWWLGGAASVLDAGTAYLAATLVAGRPGRIALAALLATWPVLNTSAVGGMETSLLGFLVLLWWTKRGSQWAAGLAPLVRPEGWLLAIAHGIRERKPAALVVLAPGLLWMGAAWMLFGSPLPLSAEAKQFVQGGPAWAKAIAWSYHLAQIPLFMFRPVKTSMVVASLSFWLLVMALSPGGRGWGIWLALGWFGFLMVTGAPIFEWYLAVPSMLLIVSGCRAEVMRIWPVAAAAIVVNTGFLFVWGVQDGGANRNLVDETWREASQYVAELDGVESVFAEAVGVLGWEFRGTVYDETGIVTPELLPYRAGGDGWYLRAVQGLQPDALLVRPYYLYRNEPIAGADKPFRSEEGFRELGMQYVEVADFADSARYATPRVNQVRVLLRRDKARALGLTPLQTR